MKLITEDIDVKDVSIKKHKDGFYYITAPCIQAGVVNGNNRIYRYPVIKEEVDNYISNKVAKNRAVGELNHPKTPEINPKEASHLIVSLVETPIDIDKGLYNWVGKSRILNTPNGMIAQQLFEGGVVLGVSSRALGSLINVNGVNEVQNDFKLCTPADIVYEPSAPDAFIQGILENKEWLVEGQGIYREIMVEQLKKELCTKPVPNSKTKLRMFRNFLSTF